MVAEASVWAMEETQVHDVIGRKNAVVKEEAAFGWESSVDPTTKRVFYVHSYTGEVRWANARDGAASPRNATQDSPWDFGGDPLYPHRPQHVLLSAGIMPSQPISSRLDSWRGGYEKYNIKEAARAAVQDSCLSENQLSNSESLQHRLLPCTWEQSSNGPPFLAPFPVAIVQPVWMHDAPPSVDVSHSQPVEWFPNSQLVYQSPLPPANVPPAFVPTYYSPVAPFPNYADHQHPGLVEFSAGCDPQFVDKAHNRRGYNIRQARKLMKDLGLRPAKAKKVVPQTGTRPCSPGPQPLHQSSHKSSTRGSYPTIAPALRPQTTIRVN